MRHERSVQVIVLTALAAAVALPAGSSAQSLVVNGSFDHDIAGWQVVSGSTTLALAHLTDVGCYLDDGSGPGALEVKMFFWNGGASGPYQDVPVTAGVEYEAAASVMLPSIDNTSNGVQLIVSWLDDRGGTIANSWLSTWGLGFDAWLRQSDTLVAPAGAVTARLIASVKTPVIENETIPGVGYFDDIVFREKGASQARQVLFVPAGASANGLNGTVWTTAGWFANLVAFPVEIRGAFLRPGQDNSAALASLVPLGTVPASGFLAVADMVAKLGGAGAAGGIYLEATAQASGLPAVLVSATTYTATPDPDSAGAYGQGLPAVASGELNRVALPGVHQDDRHRTNLGVLNTSAGTVEVDIMVRGADGGVLASATWTLLPYEQRQAAVTALGVAKAEGGFATVTRRSSAGSFRAYLSVVDAVTGDAVYTAGM